MAWYGRLVGEPNANSPKNPIDIAANLKTPVLGLYGAKDTGIPLESVERMRAALDKGNSGSAFHVYPNSGHAFHADYRPSYNELTPRTAGGARWSGSARTASCKSLRATQAGRALYNARLATPSKSRTRGFTSTRLSPPSCWRPWSPAPSASRPRLYFRSRCSPKWWSGW